MNRYCVSNACVIVSHDRQVQYVYRVNAHSTRSFSLLTEVAASRQPTFHMLIKRHGLKIRHNVELNRWPWLADMVDE
jgi:hypothetical protein